MREITLQEVLDAREARAAAQRRLLDKHRRPLLCLTMNIAGPVKRWGTVDLAFRSGAAELDQRLEGRVLERTLTDAPTGLECIWACDVPAPELKALAMELETQTPAGRLYDLDVIGADGVKLSRPVPRTCLVCGGPAAPCARSRAHGLDAILTATNALLNAFAAEHLAELAVGALRDEVELTPKPGLVDRRGSGAHRDMDLQLFYRSAAALAPYFREAAALGLAADDCMPSLQRAGLRAEEAMLAATGGVNTHRGAIYAFGLTLAALGGVLARGGDLFARAAALAAAGLPPSPATHGAQMKARYKAGGAREEALAGFPHGRAAWAALREHGGDPFPALLTLLSQVEDTNLLYRGGTEGLAFVQREAAAILAGPPKAYIPRLEALDAACVQRNLSPGGCADLLALGLLLYRTEALWIPEIAPAEEPQ